MSVNVLMDLMEMAPIVQVLANLYLLILNMGVFCEF